MACAGTKQISASLNQIYGENVNKKFQLKGSQILIGRNAHANIRLECPNVSRKHCILTYTDKRWTIRDNNSQNGTWICGRKLQPNESHLLECGDIIFLGPPSEMPQAFCFDVDYDLEESTDSPVKVSEGIRLEEFLKESKNNLPENDSLFNTSNSEIILVSPQITSPSKENPHILSSTDLLTQASSTDCSYKRKLSTTAQSQISSSSCNEQKKSKCNESIPNDFNVSPSNNLHVPDSDDQINEISSTENDQMEDSESLLDIKDKKIPDQSCLSNEESEKEILKSKLNSMAAEIEKLKNERLAFVGKCKSIWKNNDVLKKQLAEQEKLKGELQNCEQRAKSEIKKEIMEKFEEDLMCNICTELLIKPIVLECSHTFCEYCIHEWKKKKNECPMCRKKIETMTRVLTLDHLIDKTLETLTPDQKVKREELIKERLMAEQQKKIHKSPGHARYGRRRVRRRGPFRNAVRPNMEVPPRRNLLLPLQLPSVTYPVFLNNNFRIPEVLISDSEMDTINIYVS